jgi:hypothetical protein
MGWWRIDPETGMPAEGARSKLSRPPEFVLLNAVPGVDDEAEAYYLGDGPWDMAAAAANDVGQLLGAAPRPSDDELRRLFLERVLPAALAGLDSRSADRLLQVVDEMWKDVDGCYEDDWERPARPAEKKWVCEYAVDSLR